MCSVIHTLLNDIRKTWHDTIIPYGRPFKIFHLFTYWNSYCRLKKNTKSVTDWVIILLLGFPPEIIHALQNYKTSNSEHALLCGVFCRIIAAHDKALGSISLQLRLGKPCAACDNGALPYEYDHRISVSLAHQSLLALVGESDNLQEIPLNLNSAGWIKKYPWAECLRRTAALPLFFPETSYNTINLVQEEKYGT